MPRLSWSAVGERYFETGVDRGVLYVGSAPGVAWTGLTSVTQSPSGGEAKAYYIDGIKYQNISSAEEFEATINAFSCPPEFGPCDGTVSIQNGLFVTQQPRRPFGMSYRTKIGNDVDGPDFGYKIHLVYNALAAPSERANNTMGDSTDPTSLSWSITTLPPLITGYKPTGHFVIDSRKIPRGLLRIIEDILYGSDSTAPRLPSAAELIDLFKNPGAPPIIWSNFVTNPQGENVSTTSYSVIRINRMTNPRPRNYASSATVPAGWADTWAGGGTANFSSGSDGVLKKTWTTDATSDHNVFAGPRLTTPIVGSVLSGSIKVRISASPNGMPTSAVALRFEFRDSSNASLGTVTGPYVSWGALGAWLTLTCTGALVPPNTASIRVVPLPNSSVWKPLTGTVIEISEPYVEFGTQLGSFFDGDFTGSYTYAWQGTPGASMSEQRKYRAVDQQSSCDLAEYFPYWAEGTAGSMYQRWRSIAGTPTPTYRVARSTALSQVNIKNGETYTLLMRVRRTGYTDTTMNVRISPPSGVPEIMPNTSLDGVGSDWKDIRIHFTATGDAASDATIGLYCSQPLAPPATQHGYFDLEYWAVFSGTYTGDYFDGDTPDADPLFYQWEGTPHASVSTVRSWD